MNSIKIILIKNFFIFILSISIISGYNPAEAQNLVPLSSKTGTIQNKIEGDKRLFSIEVREADIKDVLRALANQSNMNVIIGEGIVGAVTFSFDKIALTDALEIILKVHNYGYVIQNNVLWIGKKDDISRAGEEMLMEIVQLNYAKASDVTAQIKAVMSEKGTATADSRTNSIIIRDAKKNIESVKTLLNTLDTQTQQVVIEARIVEANTNFSRDFGIQWGGNYKSSGGDNTIRGGANIGTSAGSRNFAVNLPAAGATSGLGLVIGSLKSNLTLDVELSAAEKTGQLRIISSPKVTTLNNKAAAIHSGLTYRVRTTSTTTTTTGGGATGAATTGTTLESVKTGIDLSVTPQVSSDDFILLNISASKSDPDFSQAIDGIPGITEKTASTADLVKDGETTVIGGLYRSSSSDTKDAVPYLSKIPLLGWLFKHTGEKKDNEELLIFITPTIVKMDKASIQ
ncbi:MAG: type IV pilus secretin PilQ, partial [Deltaproteobacteria bacterium]|nr:type IV pilus secretin PilQ [Deltaproteobacteria bacterium]